MGVDGNLEGANSIVFLCDMVHIAIPADDSAPVTETLGERVVLKCVVTPIPEPKDRRTKAYTRMLERQAPDHLVLTGMPQHPNIVPLLHHFVGPALLVRPFVSEVFLKFFSVNRTTYAGDLGKTPKRCCCSPPHACPCPAQVHHAALL